MTTTTPQVPELSTLEALLELALDEALIIERATFEAYSRDVSVGTSQAHLLASLTAKHLYGALLAREELQVLSGSPVQQEEAEEGKE